jgi:hypothetical protein
MNETITSLPVGEMSLPRIKQLISGGYPLAVVSRFWLGEKRFVVECDDPNYPNPCRVREGLRLLILFWAREHWIDFVPSPGGRYKFLKMAATACAQRKYRFTDFRGTTHTLTFVDEIPPFID